MLPIVLTEAFGCDRCQKIFVLTEKGEAIEELSPIHNYKKVWRWNGTQWLVGGQRLTQTLSIFLGIILVLAIVFGSLLLQSTTTVSMIFWMVILLALAAWLAMER